MSHARKHVVVLRDTKKDAGQDRLGFYRGDDVDPCEELDNALRYDDHGSAQEAADHANETHDLNEGEEYSPGDYDDLRQLIAALNAGASAERVAS